MLITLNQLKTSLLAMKNFIIEHIPTNVSDLNNDAGYIEEDDISSNNDVDNALTEIFALDRYVIKTASGTIASFTDGANDAPVKSLTVQIEPVQNLHGQANPYPGGGGKNLYNFTAIDAPKTENTIFSGLNLTGTAYILSFDIVGAKRGTTGNTDVIRIHCTDDTDVYGDLNNIKRVSDNVTLGNSTWPVTGRYYIKVEKAISWISFYWRSNSYLQLSAGACKNIMLEAGSSPTAYAPYENICPISGWVGGAVSRTGKNLFDGTHINGYISDDGTEGTDNTNYHSDFIRVANGQNYVYSLTSNYANNVNRRVHAYDANKNWVQMISKNATNGTGKKAFQFAVPSGIAYIKAQFIGNGQTDISDTDIQIEPGSVASDFTPYTGTTIPISWQSVAGTVYGGTLDVTTGVLTVDRACDSFTLSSSASSSTGNGFTGYGFTLTNRCSVGANVSNGKLCNLTNEYSYSSTNYGKTHFYITIAGSGNIFVPEGTSSDLTVQFCYPIETPQTYQLTPTEVSTLLGKNHIWADTGDVYVEYRS